MKVLMLTTSFPLTHNSVSGVFVKSLADSLASAHELTVLSPADSRGSKAENTAYAVNTFAYAPRCWSILAHQSGGIPVVLKNKPVAVLLIPTFLTAMLVKTMMLARSHHIIHANWAICGMLSGIAAKLLGKKSIVTLRGDDVGSLSSIKSKLAVYACLNLCDRVVTVSEGMRDMVANRWPKYKSKLLHIPNGIDEKFYNIPNAKVQCNKQAIITVGSLIPRKSVRTIIRALAEVSFPTTCTIIGDGPERKLLEELSLELNLIECVHFLGQQSINKIPTFLANHQIMVLASLSEGRANVLLEGMAAGRIIIASDIPPNREMIEDGHNGLLFEPDNYAELARLIVKVGLDSSLAKRLASCARTTVKSMNLYWSNTSLEYSSLYKTLC